MIATCPIPLPSLVAIYNDITSPICVHISLGRIDTKDALSAFPTYNSRIVMPRRESPYARRFIGLSRIFASLLVSS